MKKIQDFNFLYWLLMPYVNFVLKKFYSKVYIEGKENLPKEQPFILAPNHQNALMDALMVLAADNTKTVFLARSDIFKQKIVAKILHFLKIMPIYRIRDGRSELDKNIDIFKKSVDVLHDQVPLCLMPEGKQSLKRKLLPLVKGMFRIAFQAQEKMPEKEVMIVPVGIDYEDYISPGGHVILRFGKPIPIKHYISIYKEYQAKALNELRDEVAVGISKLIQDIRSENRYEEFYSLSVLGSRPEKGIAQLEKRRKITFFLDKQEQENPDFIEKLCQSYAQYVKQLGILKLKDSVIFENPKILPTILQSIFLVCLFPLFLTGLVVNLVPKCAVQFIVGKIKDLNFKSSVHVVLWIVIFPIYFLSVFLVLGFCWNWLYALALTFIFPFIGRFAFLYEFWVKSLFEKFSYFLKKKKYPAQINDLQTRRKNLMNVIS